MDNKDAFSRIYEKSYCLTAAVFAVANVIDDEDFKDSLKRLSLSLIPMSVSLKDINSDEVKMIVLEIEKISLELSSMLGVAAMSNMISKMNRDILKEELQFLVELLNTYANGLEEEKTGSIQSIFLDPYVANIESDTNSVDKVFGRKQQKGANIHEVGQRQVQARVNNGHKRKLQRKSAILDYIKRHNEVDIKDISSNIIGCSEKTIQRELIELIKEGKIKKKGARRWSRYAPVE